VFLLIVWLAASLNFFLPKLSGQDPVRTKLLAAALGRICAGWASRRWSRSIRSERFGLDKPLWRQYVSYLGDTARLDFNYSIANYPRTVTRADRRGICRGPSACWA
jgi:peptide/nickel transport system permease protein